MIHPQTTTESPTLILDGRALAARRLPGIRARAAAVRSTLGRAPSLFLLAFAGPDGAAPWVQGKLRACAEAGIDAETLVLPGEVTTEEAHASFAAAVAAARSDAVFVQFPFPPAVDGAVLSRVIPASADVDVMRPDGIDDYLAGSASSPPLTVAAVLALFDAHDIQLWGRTTSVVAESTPFERILTEALSRRGGSVRTVAPDARDLSTHLAASSVVVTSAARPGIVRTADLTRGAVVVDGGYFNPGGRGDVDVSGGIDHLGAFAPVPGGVGPMTVSMLIEAVVGRAERSSCAP